MARKTVPELKRKHRNSTWLDSYNQVWFWDTHRQSWWFLAAGVDPDVEPGFTAARPYFSELIGRTWGTYGPFTRIAEAEYED